MFTEQMWNSFELEQKIRELQPHIIINNRASLPGDFDTPEGSVGFFQNHRHWETCMPLGESWAWNGKDVKPFDVVIKQLVGCACGDGNYLLSIGAMSNGEFAENETRRIEELGDWLNKYGEGIYKTNGGPFLPGKWGGSTFKGNVVYLYLFDKTIDKFNLPCMNNELVEALCLTGEEFLFKQQEEDMLFELKINLDVSVTVIKLVFKNKIHSNNLVELLFNANSIHFYNLSVDNIIELKEVINCKKIILDSPIYPLKIFTSLDNQDWDCILDSEEKETKEIPLSHFEAGAMIDGNNIKFIKTTNNIGKINIEL